MLPPPIEQGKHLDFAVVGDPLNKLLIDIGNKLSREWPVKYRNVIGARELFVMQLRVAHLTYRSALYLGGDIPADERRLPEFCISLPLLNRAILDSLLTVMFILEDLPARCAWFRGADWKETRLEFERYSTEYGSSPDPAWQQYLQGLALACDMNLKLTNLTPAQTANPRGLRHWPNPGAMVNDGVSPKVPRSPAKAFMKYLDDFFYTDLSQQAKLGGLGNVKRAAFLMDEIRHLPGTDAQIKKYRYAQMGQAVALVLALASEIEAHFSCGSRGDALSIWQLASPAIVVVNEVYQKRYRELLE